MTRKLFRDISASALQVILNQAFGLVVFLLTSLYLAKDLYGELNWSVAFITFATTVLSLRLEQIVVKKAATETNSSAILTLFLLHVLVWGLAFYAALLIFSYCFPLFFSKHQLLLLIGVSQLLIFFASPFKQVANGKERFGELAVMSSVSNFIRSAGLLAVIVFDQLTIRWVLWIFIAGSFTEFMTGYLIVTRRMQTPLTTSVRFSDYTRLLKESLPQIGAAILMAGISRMDWILLGIFTTAGITAEYSFAYRLYELSPFPLLIIAPVLLSRLSRFFSDEKNSSLLPRKKEIGMLLRYEMVLATLIPLVLNILWSPVLDPLTGKKYGSVNQVTFLILSFAIPFQYLGNLLWSAEFARHNLKRIFGVTLVTFSIILAGDLLFIPKYAANGAALVYLTAVIVEYLNYMRLSELSRIPETWSSLLYCAGAAALSGFSATYISAEPHWRLAIALPLFFSLLVATKQLKSSDMMFIRQAAGLPQKQ